MDTRLIGQCVTSASKVNGAIKEWNTAVRNDSASGRDDAADRFGRTAGELRTTASKSKNEGFASRLRDVAGEMEDMEEAHESNKSVDSGGLNTAYRALSNWCSDQLKPS